MYYCHCHYYGNLFSQKTGINGPAGPTVEPLYSRHYKFILLLIWQLAYIANHLVPVVYMLSVNPSNPDTLVPEETVLIFEVSSFQNLKTFSSIGEEFGSSDMCPH